ncbi:hypothetical protein MRX96_031936 [Rhipicephalus microplus]
MLTAVSSSDTCATLAYQGDQLEQVSLEASPCATSMLCGRSTCTVSIKETAPTVSRRCVLLQQHESLAGRQLMCRHGDRWQLRGVAAQSCDHQKELQRFHHLDEPRLAWIRNIVQP